MKVARLYSFGDIRIEEMPVPDGGEGDALIRVRASGVCSGDAMPWYIEKKAPLVLGHEPTGEVVAVGNHVEGFSPGDRVFVHHHAPCLSCGFCRRGDYVQCPSWKHSRIIPGGISEYALIPALNLNNDTLKLPDAVSFEDGTLIEPTACVAKSFRRSGLSAGDTVLVIGLGVMGMLHILLGRHYGAGRTIGADRVPFRLRMAKQLGADESIHVDEMPLKDRVLSLTGGKGAEIVVVGPNDVQAINSGMACLAPGGTLLLFTPAKPGEAFSFDVNEAYFRDLKIVTSYSSGPNDTKEALRLITHGLITAGKLVTHRFPIEETSRAFEIVSRPGDSMKVIIAFQ